MKPLLEYTLLRILLLFGVGGFAFAVGMRGLLLMAVAFIGSGVLSYFVLGSQRARLGMRVGGVFRGINERIDRAAAAEDQTAENDGTAADEVAVKTTETGADISPRPHRNAAR